MRNPFNRLILVFVEWGFPIIIAVMLIINRKWILGICAWLIFFIISRKMARFHLNKTFAKEIEGHKSMGHEINEDLIKYIEEELWRRSRGEYF
jgi:hypothetical protein